MKDFLKMLAFIEFIALVVYGCVWIVFQFTGDKISPMVLPVYLLIVLGAVILLMIIEPISEWWLS
jgi:hypothetical protein